MPVRGAGHPHLRHNGDAHPGGGGDGDGHSHRPRPGRLERDAVDRGDGAGRRRCHVNGTGSPTTYLTGEVVGDIKVVWASRFRAGRGKTTSCRSSPTATAFRCLVESEAAAHRRVGDRGVLDRPRGRRVGAGRRRDGQAGARGDLRRDRRRGLDGKRQLEDAGAAGEWHGVTTDAAAGSWDWISATTAWPAPLPPALGSLARLRWLDLGSNDLTGPIPAALGNLANLGALSLAAMP